jgi:hypothetical protein
MNDEAESSRLGERSHHGDNDAEANLDSDGNIAFDGLEEEDEAQREQRFKERRLDAKRKRVNLLDHLLRELDTLVFVELITLYHLEYVYHILRIKVTENSI